MSNHAFEELAQEVLEGSATPEQRSALEARIAANPAAREQWDTLQATFRALNELRPVAPPPDLKPGVMRAIRAERAASSTPFAAWRAWLGRALAPQMLSAFAAGAAAGILLWTAAIGTHGTRSDLPASGTMMPNPAGAPPILDRVTLGAGRAKVWIETLGAASSIEARIDAHAAGSTELVFEYDPALEPEALDALQPKPERVSFASGRVALSFSGDFRCTIRFHGERASQQPIRVALRSPEGATEGVLDGR